ncbi:unnamed protein product [Closterium sp. NIES-54]
MSPMHHHRLRSSSLFASSPLQLPSIASSASPLPPSFLALIRLILILPRPHLLFALFPVPRSHSPPFSYRNSLPQQALLALLLIVLLLLPFPLLLQYAYAPSSSPTFVSSFGSSSSSSSSSPGSSASAEPGSEAWVQLRVLNFNVQQGFSRAGSVNMDAVEHVIWQQKPDIVFMAGSWGCSIHPRALITSPYPPLNPLRSLPQVQYLATWLGMHAWSSPPTRHQSWGCAILSRFPLLSASPSQSLPSPHGELACFQHAVILLGAGNMLPGGGNMVTSSGAAAGGNQTSGVVSGYPVHIMNAHFSDLEVDIRLEAERAASLVRSVLQTGKGGKEGGGEEGVKEDGAEREERRTQEEGLQGGMETAGELSGEISGDVVDGTADAPSHSPAHDVLEAESRTAAGGAAATAEATGTAAKSSLFSSMEAASSAAALDGTEESAGEEEALEDPVSGAEGEAAVASQAAQAGETQVAETAEAAGSSAAASAFVAGSAEGEALAEGNAAIGPEGAWEPEGAAGSVAAPTSLAASHSQPASHSQAASASQEAPAPTSTTNHPLASSLPSTPTPPPTPAPFHSLAPTALIFGGDFNLPPLSPPYLTLLSSGLIDTEAEKMGAWKSMGDRDPGAGYLFVSRGNVECEAWAEPRYDQRKTSDGYPVVVDVRVTLPAAAV